MVLSRLICSERKPLSETIFQTLWGGDYFSLVINKNQSVIHWCSTFSSTVNLYTQFAGCTQGALLKSQLCATGKALSGLESPSHGQELGDDQRGSPCSVCAKASVREAGWKTCTLQLWHCTAASSGSAALP